MQITLRTRRHSSGAAIFLGILIIAALGLGGCALYKIQHKAKEIEKKRQAQISNELAQAVSPPIYGPISQPGPQLMAAPPMIQVWTNEALSDESGF